MAVRKKIKRLKIQHNKTLLSVIILLLVLWGILMLFLVCFGKSEGNVLKIKEGESVRLNERTLNVAIENSDEVLVSIDGINKTAGIGDRIDINNIEFKVKDIVFSESGSYAEFEIGDSEKTTECFYNSDCVPADCCHASSCASVSEAPECSDIFCTMECSPGTLDCGQGECRCVDGKCGAVFD